MRLRFLVPILFSALSAAATAAQSGDAVVNLPTLTSEGATMALAAAEHFAVEKGHRVSIAVVDGAGNLLLFKRLGNAMPASIDNAVAKARTAAQLGMPSKVVQDLVDGPNPSMLAVTGIAPLQGGMPIIVQGSVVGGIGSSGVASEDDEAVARAGAAALGSP